MASGRHSGAGQNGATRGHCRPKICAPGAPARANGGGGEPGGWLWVGKKNRAGAGFFVSGRAGREALAGPAAGTADARGGAARAAAGPLGSGAGRFFGLLSGGCAGAACGAGGGIPFNGRDAQRGRSALGALVCTNGEGALPVAGAPPNKQGSARARASCLPSTDTDAATSGGGGAPGGRAGRRVGSAAVRRARRSAAWPSAGVCAAHRARQLD